MTAEEFKTQIFKTPEQWGSGLFYRLEAQEKGGITLYPAPVFVQWILQVDNGVNNPTGLAVDECGQIYIFDSDTKSKICRLYRYDCGTQNLELLSYIIDPNLSLAVDECIQISPFDSNIKPKIRKLNLSDCGNQNIERLSDITDCNSNPGNVQCPKRMLLSKYTLWVNDTANKRVLAFSREDYQIKNIIDKLNDEIIEPVDIGLDERGNLYALIKKSGKYHIVKYDKYGNFINDFELNSSVVEAVGIASGKKNVLYVIDKKEKQLLKYTESDSSPDPFTVDLKDKMSDIQGSGIVVDIKGNIFVSDCSKGLIHQFDPDGNSLGIVQGFNGAIQGIAVDSKGSLYVSSDKGICKLDAQNTFTKETGTYYSKTLDSGILECQWHRMVLETDLPPKTVVEISYSSSDESYLQIEIDNKIADNKIPKQEIAKYLDGKLKWSQPEKNPKDMLFRGKQGRYLWLRVKLSTFDEKVKPTITQMKIHYPRISYLRYLPAIYQENPASKEFLERFLSIFETTSYDLETRISHIYKYFDPDTVPPNFLNWLASWLNVALEEDWQEEKKRQLIQEAYSLYKQKGTPSGIERLIEIYTGKKPVLLEHSKIEKPMVLRENGDLKLGINSFLIETPLTGLRLGDEAILGRIVLQDSVRSPEDPFLATAHRFTIMLDLSDDEKIRFEKQLRRILDDEKPAHTMYTLRFSSSTNNLETYVGINTKLDYYNPLRLGADATIGSIIVVTDGERGSRIGQNSVVGIDTELI